MMFDKQFSIEYLLLSSNKQKYKAFGASLV